MKRLNGINNLLLNNKHNVKAENNFSLSLSLCGVGGACFEFCVCTWMCQLMY